jgi:hypothetical protein
MHGNSIPCVIYDERDRVMFLVRGGLLTEPETLCLPTIAFDTAYLLGQIVTMLGGDSIITDALKGGPAYWACLAGK